MQTRRRWLAACAGLALVAGLGAGGAWYYHSNRPEYRLRQGREALRRHDWAAARQQADGLENSGHPDHAHLLRGQIHLHQGELTEAIREYNAIRHDKPEVLAEASLVYGLGLLSVGKLVEAERLLRYVLDVRPNNTEAHRGLAKLYYERGALSHAIKHLEKWSRLVPHDGEPHRWLALAYADLDADEPAAEQYRLALTKKLSPRLGQEVVVEWAELLVKQRQFAEALDCLERGQLEAHRESLPVRELRAECLYGVGQGDDAAHILDRVLAANPDAPRALRVRALIHAAAGETAEAVVLLERALRIDAHDHACRYQLALAYAALGRPQEAAEQRRLLKQTEELLRQWADLNQEASANPADSQIRRRLAEVCTELGKPEMAQRWLRAAAACPTDPAPKEAKINDPAAHFRDKTVRVTDTVTLYK
jgi:tetratricopeptide (TPR) repeat protein